MPKVLIVYWSGTGNTEKMAQSIAKGVLEKGADVVSCHVSDVLVEDLLEFDILAFGSPSMGGEVIEESEMEPFFSDALPLLKGKKVGLFGSYGWGDGEWMRFWVDRCKEAGINLMDEGLIVNETPNIHASDLCVEWGTQLAEF